MALEQTRRIDVLDVVKADAIDDRYFDKPYYLTAGRGGDAAYALLREAIRDSGQVAVGKFVMRDVEHLVAVEVVEDALVLSTLRFAAELVDAGSLRFPAGKTFRKQELETARTLVKHLSAEWEPEKYTDDYRENLLGYRVSRSPMSDWLMEKAASAPSAAATTAHWIIRDASPATYKPGTPVVS